MRVTNRKTHGKKQLWINLRYNPNICLEGLRKTTRKLKLGELRLQLTLSTYSIQVRSTAVSANLV
jgi:hypothetical protein